jgi:hypothetical protein
MNAPFSRNTTSTLVLHLWFQHHHPGRPVLHPVRETVRETPPLPGGRAQRRRHRAVHHPGRRRSRRGARRPDGRPGAVRPPGRPPAGLAQQPGPSRCPDGPRQPQYPVGRRLSALLHGHVGPGAVRHPTDRGLPAPGLAPAFRQHCAAHWLSWMATCTWRCWTWPSRGWPATLF